MLLSPLIAVDVGNSRIKLGLFRHAAAAGLPEPETTLHLTGRLPEFDQLDAWLMTVLAGTPSGCSPGRQTGRAASPLAHWQRQPPGSIAADRLAPRSSRGR